MHLPKFTLNLNSMVSVAYCTILVQLLCLTFPAFASMLGNETDRVALLSFKSQISESSVGILSSWNDTLHFCQWNGVTCSFPDQRVTRLDLGNQKLIGTISPSIGNLSFLQYLNLSYNSFRGRIPSKTGNLFDLRVLDLSYNLLQGEIPTNISSCYNLTELALHRNNLSGEIPPELTILSKLEHMSLSANSLRGRIPASIGNLSSLRTIYLSYNQLEGEIPDTISLLQNVTDFLVTGNNLTGVIPPSFYNLSSLQILSLTSNKFSGHLRPDIGHLFPNLQLLYLGFNEFTGTIPASLSNASNLQELDIPFNNFVGTVPLGLGKLPNLQKLNIPGNSLGNHAEYDLNFITSLTNLSRLQSLDIGANRFGGNLPHAISNLSTDLYWLQMALLGLGGSIPAGITNLVNLQVLDLGSNVLSGSIPPTMGQLSNLQDVHLGMNMLTGNLPMSIGNITQLSRLILSENNLTGTIPSTLERCKRLEILGISTNNFIGTIPKAVIGLEFLTYLNTSNNLLNGIIPSSTEFSQHLDTLDVSNNRLSGQIPNTLGKCLALETLYVQRNYFQGTIPDLSQVKGLQILDLSHNNLSGEVPKYMENFTSLQYLNLSFNGFQGEVPLHGIFRNASALGISGINGLCGGIHELQLPPCPALEPEKPKKHFPVRVIVVIFIVALISIIGLLLILVYKKTKKKARPPSAPSFGHLYPLITYKDLHKATGGFSSDNVIGTGSFGTVYKADLSLDGTTVAVKVLNLVKHGAPKSFVAECQALGNVRHRNLVKLLTACSSTDYNGNDFKALVYQFMTYGNLDNWLHPEDGKSRLTLLERLNIAIDIASALQYLHHECPTPIVHCDLKPSNVLLDNDMTAHVSDFGLAKLLPEASKDAILSQFSSAGIKGTIGYAAPEYGMGGQVSIHGDIYSYGILLLEMFTGRRPTGEQFKDGFNIQTFVKSALPERVAKIVDQAAISDITSDEESSCATYLTECLISLFHIGLACSAENPRDRMSMTDVVSSLHSLKDTFINLFL